MSLLACKKSGLKFRRNISDEPEKKKAKTDQKYMPRKSRESKKATRVRRVARKGNLLSESAAIENESSRGNLMSEKPKNARNLKKSPSNASVIYVGTFPSHTNPPVVDLTQSSENQFVNTKGSKTLKTIYFPSRNFERKSTLFRSYMSTRSLITLPVTKKTLLVKRPNTAGCKNVEDKLGVLDIPKEYLNESDLSNTDISLANANLTPSDFKIIDWILQQDKPLDRNQSDTSSSGYNSSLDVAEDSIEVMCEVYGVSTKDRFS